MIKVLLDTNFLIYVFTKHVNVHAELAGLFSDFELIIISPVLEEFRRLEPRKEELLRKILNEWKAKFVTVQEGGRVDNLLVNYAVKHKCMVATQDLMLRKRLRKEGVESIVLRQGKYVRLANPGRNVGGDY